MTEIGIVACATVLGEAEITHAELATLHGTGESVVRKWLGQTKVYASDLDAPVLALRAATDCLARAGVEAKDLSVVVGSQCSALRLQHELGALNAYTMQGVDGCSEFVPQLLLSQALLANEPEGALALIGFTDKMAPNAMRSFGAMTELVMRDVFSDGASAVIVRRGHSRLRPIGFGMASDGAHWDYFNRYFAGEPVNDLEVMKSTIEVVQTAFRRCLQNAQLPLEAFQWVMFPLEGPRLPFSFARALQIPREKIYVTDDGPTHLGVSDPVFALESFLRSGRAKEGDRILVAARAVGIVRFVALQV
jgi:3-oxoacyl-[acyl-carrier-protein] synthase III